MTDKNKKPTETDAQDFCRMTVRNAEEKALLTYFRQFDVMGRALLLMKAEGMAEAQAYQKAV